MNPRSELERAAASARRTIAASPHVQTGFDGVDGCLRWRSASRSVTLSLHRPPRLGTCRMSLDVRSPGLAYRILAADLSEDAPMLAPQDPAERVDLMLRALLEADEAEEPDPANRRQCLACVAALADGPPSFWIVAVATPAHGSTVACPEDDPVLAPPRAPDVARATAVHRRVKSSHRTEEPDGTAPILCTLSRPVIGIDLRTVDPLEAMRAIAERDARP